MRLLMIGTAFAAAYAFMPVTAEAAKCRYGQIYRPSLGICQAKGTKAAKAVYRPRAAYRAPKYRVRLPARQRAIVARTEAIQKPAPVAREDAVKAQAKLQQELWIYAQQNREWIVGGFDGR
jgi:hypothetical protein